jgi:hypothetical protein
MSLTKQQYWFDINLQNDIEQEDNDLEQCVICGNTVLISKQLNINMRDCFVEGAGQLCYKCWKDIN